MTDKNSPNRIENSEQELDRTNGKSKATKNSQNSPREFHLVILCYVRACVSIDTIKN